MEVLCQFNKLIDKQQKIGVRYQAIFMLKDMNSIEELVKAYQNCKDSVLLSHQILYVLGQLPSKYQPLIKQFLIQKVNNLQENNLSRHEAAQALANYYFPELQQLYLKHLKSDCKQLKWTCQIALQKIRNASLKDKYGLSYGETRQPAAPFSNYEFENFLDTMNLRTRYQQQGFLGLLLLEEIPLFDKYRIMYHMRDLKTKKCIQTLCKLLSKEYFKTQTSLLKHQICFILGQIGCENYQDLVRECIENDDEQDIVRHQALAAVASQSKDEQYVKKFINHENSLIRQSAQVALFMIRYWKQ